MRRTLVLPLLTAMLLFGAMARTPALAQDPQEQRDVAPGLTLLTSYPAQEAKIGEIVTFPLTLRIAGTRSQIVRLDMSESTSARGSECPPL